MIAAIMLYNSMLAIDLLLCVNSDVLQPSSFAEILDSSNTP